MKRQHPLVELDSNNKSKSGKLDNWVTKENTIAGICVDIAIAGTPFSFFDKPEVRRLTNFAMQGAQVRLEEITAEKVRTGVTKKAVKLREKLKQKLKGKKLSISADFGTRHGVDFLGKILLHWTSCEKFN